MTRFIFMLILVACVSIFTDIGFAQDDVMSGGILRGQITDVTLRQNPIEGVEVKVVSQNGGKEWTTKTDVDGNYKHAGLPAGRYLISISKDGYDRSVGKPVTIVDGGDHFVPLKMAQKGNIEPFFEVQKKRKDIAIKQEIKPRVESLLQGIAESVGRRYDLDPAAVNALRLSILESVEIALKRDGSIYVFAKAVEGGSVGLLKVLLSRLDCKMSLAKYLSEAQLQDYVNAVKARLQQDRHASARLITGLLSRELSLTALQHENVEQLLINAAENESFPTAMSVLGMDSQDAVNLLHFGLKISMDGILSQAQSEVWQVLVRRETNKSEGKVETFTQVDDDTKILLQERQKQLAEAKLVAHTELLGTLNENATRRLTVAIKGTVQQYFEAREEDAETMFRKIEALFMELVESGEMKREHAAENLNDMRADLWNEKGDIRRQLPYADITRHPLYQQTIKEVLSECAFAQYIAHREKKAGLLKHASTDAVIACLDAQILLTNAQREKFKLTVSKLAFPPSSNRPAMDLFSQFKRRVDRTVLNQWQWGEFQRLSSIF